MKHFIWLCFSVMFTAIAVAAVTHHLAVEQVRLVIQTAAGAEGFGAEGPVRRDITLVHAGIGAVTNITVHPDHIEVNGREGSRRWF